MRYFSRPILLACTCFLFTVSANAQTVPGAAPAKKKESRTKVHFGIGAGLDYGGFGGRVEARPFPHLGGFLGFGYNLHKLGYNIGLRGYYPSGRRVEPFLTAMWGYNAVILIQNARQYSKTYYGPTAGGGIDVRVGRDKNKFSFGMLLPIRNEEFAADHYRLLHDGNVKVEQDVLPFAFSAGFNFIL